MNKIITLLIVTGLGINTKAQFYIEQNSLDRIQNNTITWGIKAGWNYDNFYGKEIDYLFANDKTTYQSGFHVGIFVDTSLSDHFGLKHELILKQKQIKVSQLDQQDEVYQSKLTMSYIDLIPANITLTKNNFQLFAGPYISALVNANIQRKERNGNIVKDKSIYGNGSNDESESYYLQKFDFGLNIGLQYQWINDISIGARYTHGFSDIFQLANSYANDNPKTDRIKIYNRGFMLSLGYTFGNIPK